VVAGKKDEKRYAGRGEVRATDEESSSRHWKPLEQEKTLPEIRDIKDVEREA